MNKQFIIDTIDRYGRCEVSRHIAEEMFPSTKKSGLAMLILDVAARQNELRPLSAEDRKDVEGMTPQEHIAAFCKKHGLTHWIDLETRNVHFRRLNAGY